MFRAYFLPHPPLILNGIGKENDVLTTKKAFHQVKQEINDFNPDLIIIISPHGICFHDSFWINLANNWIDDLTNFHSPITINVNNDSLLAKKIVELVHTNSILQINDYKISKPVHDHGSIVPISLLDLKNVLNLNQAAGLNELKHYQIGMLIFQACQGLKKRIVFIASGDLSHYLATNNQTREFRKEGKIFDHLIQKYIIANDYHNLVFFDQKLANEAGQCGLKSLAMLYGFCDQATIQSRILSYEAPYGVGYLCASFTFIKSSDSKFAQLLKSEKEHRNQQLKKENEILSLARLSVETYVTTGKIYTPVSLSEQLKEKNGCFVSIHSTNEQLRGCIGTLHNYHGNLANEIIHNAINAAINDQRFSPICIAELDQLTYHVDVLSPLEKIDDWKQLNPKKYGVYLVAGKKSGVLLPNLDGVETIAQQIAIAKQKGGINSQEETIIYRFTTTRFKI